MAQADIINIARKYAAAVKSKFSPSKLYLFGSQVKGNLRKDSDIDIAVVLKDYEKKLEIQIELMRLRRKIDSRIEPHPFRESEFGKHNVLANEVINNSIEIA
ncbi:MAG: nucleotidyltransferase domain-containing protein [Ignavibacteria bacterium]|jgi:predicted nucleotidyltransferase|nr:nucleotidyltransferase domain-containing protein [Ignavibacteria bacterium]